MLVRTRDRTVAYAPYGAFAATSLLFFFGLVGAFTAFTVVLATGGGEAAPFLGGMSQIATALTAAFASCALGGFGGLVLAGQSKAGLDPNGDFVVRSWPPGRVRSIRLAALTHISSSRGPLRRRGLLAATRHSTTLSLHDRNGSTVKWNPSFWRDSEAVIHALRESAVAAGATADPGAVGVFDHPPFGPTL